MHSENEVTHTCHRFDSILVQDTPARPSCLSASPVHWKRPLFSTTGCIRKSRTEVSFKFPISEAQKMQPKCPEKYCNFIPNLGNASNWLTSGFRWPPRITLQGVPQSSRLAKKSMRNSGRIFLDGERLADEHMHHDA